MEEHKTNKLISSCHTMVVKGKRWKSAGVHKAKLCNNNLVTSLKMVSGKI